MGVKPIGIAFDQNISNSRRFEQNNFQDLNAAAELLFGIGRFADHDSAERAERCHELSMLRHGESPPGRSEFDRPQYS